MPANRTYFAFLIGGMCVLLVSFFVHQLVACPLCEAIGSTLSDDLQAPALGVVVEVIGCEARDDGAGYNLSVQFIGLVGEQKTIPKFQGVFSFHEVPRGKKILLIGTPDVVSTESDSLDDVTWLWNTPLELSDAAADYVRNLPLANSTETERLAYFYANLFSRDSLISSDAYSECARISLQTIRGEAFRKTFSKTRLVESLRDSDFPARYKSFLWMVLAELGEQNDAPLFDELAMPLIIEELKNKNLETIQASTLANYPWLAASMACYVRLGGESAFQVLEDNLLRNRECPVGLKSAAISAIRVFGSDLDPTQTSRAARALTMVLEDPVAADLVIPDLARWEYWDAIPQLAKVFHTPESEQGLARYLIINYMRHCPLPQASDELAKMKALDPKSYRRAVAMVPNVEVPQNVEIK